MIAAMRRLVAALACAAVASPAWAGHEVSYYPSFYPQEIRIEPLDPERAAREFLNTTDPLHAYVGAAPRFAGAAPSHLKSVASLNFLVTVTLNPKSPFFSTREARCREIESMTLMDSVAAIPGMVAHRYPVTPFHADYLSHTDRVPAGKPPTASARHPFPKFRAGITGMESPLEAQHDPGEWDASIDEVRVAELIGKAFASAGMNASLVPWAKNGWFQSYHLLRPALGSPDAGKRADEIYDRLTHDEFKDAAERINLERELITVLSANCERVVVGYGVRREFHNDDFSNGIENILVDSQAGFNAPMFLRTVKLKDFPWNGWLRLGVATQPAAAWNPVAGFTDAAGHLVWSAIGDDAFLPIPHNSRWVGNRVELRPDDGPRTKQSLRIPADAIVPERGGRLVPVSANAAATEKITYRVLASEFHDGTLMETADLLYPYALAMRWGEQRDDGKTFDPAVAAATRLMRERFRGARVVKVEETTLALADLTFTYRSPIVEVYLDNLSADAHESAVLAPPWSSVPWHVLALMEAAVERGIAAFSQGEAKRRGVPWLDLVRDPAQLASLRALIAEFAAAGYRPGALETLVTPDAAKARWQALEKFVAEKGHLLVTNGPYRLGKVAPEAIVLDVVREFTYPVGLGTFNQYTYPPRALITTVARVGDQIVIAADVEMAIKAQRDHKIVRTALKRDTMRDTLPITPEAHYLVLGADGKVVAAGRARWQADGRFAVALPAGLPAGSYTAYAAIYLDGNTVAADIGQVSFRKD